MNGCQLPHQISAGDGNEQANKSKREVLHQSGDLVGMGDPGRDCNDSLDEVDDDVGGANQFFGAEHVEEPEAPDVSSGARFRDLGLLWLDAKTNGDKPGNERPDRRGDIDECGIIIRRHRVLDLVRRLTR